MDADDLVIIDSEPLMKASTSPVAQVQNHVLKHNAGLDDDSGPDARPIIHTNTMIRSNKLRYHNYLQDTNDNCNFCHDFLLQTYRERRFASLPPPPSLMAPVGCSRLFNACSLNGYTASAAANALQPICRSFPYEEKLTSDSQ